jgi:hypothetical protein
LLNVRAAEGAGHRGLLDGDPSQWNETHRCVVKIAR